MNESVFRAPCSRMDPDAAPSEFQSSKLPPAEQERFFPRSFPWQDAGAADFCVALGPMCGQRDNQHPEGTALSEQNESMYAAVFLSSHISTRC